MIKLTKIREEHGLSQGELAEAVGVTRVAINRIENGHTVPTIGTLIALADYFEKSPGWAMTLLEPVR